MKTFKEFLKEEITIEELEELAKRYNINSNSDFCIQSANETTDKKSKRYWLLKSLKHSLGVLSPIYQKVIKKED